jgi:hypothetical protein
MAQDTRNVSKLQDTGQWNHNPVSSFHEVPWSNSMDSQLTFKEHVNNISSKIAKKKKRHLWRQSASLSKWTRKVIYYTIISPHFTYCATLLFGIQNRDLSLLQKLQSRGMRAIF